MTTFSCSESELEVPNQKVRTAAENRESGCDISVVGPNCDSVLVYDTINIDGCFIPVSYLKVICFTYPQLTMTIANLNVSMDIGNTVPCINLATWWSLYDHGHFAASEQAWVDFLKALSIAIEKKNLAQFIADHPAYNYNCNSSTGVVITNSEFIQTNCKKICAEHDGERYNLRDVVCGRGCCKRRTRYCLDGNGNLVTVGTPDIDFIQGCITVEDDCAGVTPFNCRNSCSGLE